MKINATNLKISIISSIGWFPVAVFALFIKKVNIELRYFQILYKFSNVGTQATLADYLSIYKSDILFNFFLIPILIMILVYFFPKRRALYFITLISFTLLVLLFANMHSWGTLGKFLNGSALIDAAVFALQSPKFITMYIDFDSWLKLSVLVFSSILGYLFARKIANLKYINFMAVLFVGVILSSAFFAVLIGNSSKMKKNDVFQNFIALSISSFFDYQIDTNNETIPKEDIVGAYTNLTNTNFSNESGFKTKSAGNDLILFILETGPTEFINLENDIESFPTLKKLSTNSLISTNHHTTYPGSSQALFSLFLSVYPPFNYYNSCISKKATFEKPFPGFISKFREIGYITQLYLPFKDVIPIDKILHNNIGFNKIYCGEDDELKKQSPHGFDLLALNEMKKDISLSIDKGEPFVSVFLPQIGHAPWPDRPGSIPVKAYGKKLAVIQDQWLGEIVNLLEQKGRLDKTTILVTSDHGIRTAQEDPDFNMGFIDKYSYSVPLMIYSKKSFSRPVIVNTKTSHLDISPSLLDLFGIEREGMMEQGVCVLDKNIAERDLFLLGHWHCDVDGYFSKGDYYMYNEVFNFCFKNSAFDFSFSNLLKDEKEESSIKDKINKLYDIQNSWYLYNFCNE